MRFSAIHKVVSYLMCAAAFLALALSRELSPAVVVATALLGAGSYVLEPGRWDERSQQRWTLVWNVLTLLTFAYTVVHAITGGDVLGSGVRLLCFLLVNKLCNRRASRDYQQAYVLSFLMLVAGAALSADLSYAFCFLLYVVCTTWSLTLFHLRREMEDNYLLKHSDDAQSERVEVERILNSRRIVGGSFLVGTALVSIAIFVASAIAFFLIPRVGFGFFSSHGRKQQAMVGFNDHVELGEYGVVKDNPQIVMRVELPAGLPVEPLRFRGVAFDKYNAGQWSRSGNIPKEPFYSEQTIGYLGVKSIDRKQKAQLLKDAIEQRIYLDPLETSLLFAASTPVAFEISAIGPGGSRLELDGRRAGEVFVKATRRGYNGEQTVEHKGALRYTAYSNVSRPDFRRLINQPAVEVPAELRPYLALPKLPPRVAELARALVAGHKSAFTQAFAVEQYLQTKLRYTLDLKRDERYEPIEDFLFVQKAGHCEYFASAMAVLLRTVGIPTRVVNGFLGGEWNEYGKYLAVRQGDAHSWVEVWVGGAGWVTFDPTPVGPPPVKSSAFAQRMRQLIDNMELAWFKYVIEYDLSKQVDLAQGARRAVGDGFNLTKLRAFVTRVAPWLGGLGLIAAAIVVLRRRNLGAVRRRRPTELLLDRALHALERRGVHRALGETSRELGQRARGLGDPGAEAFVELVERCYAVRYGGEDVPAAELESLLGAVVRPPPIAP